MYLLLVMTLTIDRTQKVKDARKEAAKEIEAYKAQKEKEFNEFASKVHSLHMMTSQ
jgi:V-type H+-transporting ATPase subunit G